MADDNRMNDDKRIYERRGGSGDAGRSAFDAAYFESACPVSRPNGPDAPYGGFGDSPDTHIGGTQPIPIKKGLFDGISVAQVIAASAAAATSMLLASHIGIAGSVIGAAVSSMVTVICSQLYRNALDASARKLKAKQMSHVFDRDVPGNCSNIEGARATDEGFAGAPRIRIAPTKLQARAAAERSASKRKVAVVSALIATAAVAASAGLIMLTTSGQGLGTRAPSVFGNRPTDSRTTTATADDPIETPASRANPNTPDDKPAKPENGASPDGNTGAGAGEGSGEVANGAPNGGETAQQDGSATGSDKPAPDQADANNEGTGDDTPTSTSKRPPAGTGGVTGSANTAAPSS